MILFDFHGEPSLPNLGSHYAAGLEAVNKTRVSRTASIVRESWTSMLLSRIGFFEGSGDEMQ
jgi:hypothetical protein